MAEPKAKTLRGKSEAELGEDVKKLRDQLFRLRWQAASGSLENPTKIREVRRSIARHLTVLGQRRKDASGGGKP